MHRTVRTLSMISKSIVRSSPLNSLVASTVTSFITHWTSRVVGGGLESLSNFRNRFPPGVEGLPVDLAVGSIGGNKWTSGTTMVAAATSVDTYTFSFETRSCNGSECTRSKSHPTSINRGANSVTSMALLHATRRKDSREISPRESLAVHATSERYPSPHAKRHATPFF